MAKIGVIGHGVVGKAVEYAFTTALNEVYVVDPIYNTNVKSMYETMTPDIVFVCVPTPTVDKRIDCTALENVLNELNAFSHRPVVVIKSTITPDVCDKLDELYSPLVFNPEFLTEHNSKYDIIHPNFLLLGGKENDMNYVETFYKKHSLCVIDNMFVFKVDPKTTSLVKYSLNAFMATKVIFFNQINAIYKKSGSALSWNDFIEIVSTDSRIGKTHMNVPGKDGKYGFGGMCFPKDTEALIQYSKDVESPFTLLEEVVKTNEKIRN